MGKRTSRYTLRDSLGYLTYEASGAIRKRIVRELGRKGYPIGAEQFSALIYVWDADGEPQRVLAEKMYRDKSTVTRLVGQIEAMGYIQRVPGERDTREKRVFLTEKGKELMAGATQLVQEILQLCVKGIDRNEVRICKDVLRCVWRNLL
jgi:MarR family transcriptional regulator, organic hydroperoxide resistance regulator